MPAGARADVLMFLLGCFAEPSMFLLVGNALCTVGNGLWVYLLGTWGPENAVYQLAFALFTIANAYSTKCSFARWKAMPPEPESDDDDDEAHDRIVAQRAIEAAGGAAQLKRQLAEAEGTRKHKKSYKAPPKPHQPRRRALNKNL